MNKAFFSLILLITIVPSLQAQSSQFYMPYQAYLEDAYLEWEAIWDAVAEGCATQNPCSTSIDYESLKVPYRLHFRNESSLFQFDVRSFDYVIRRVFHVNYDGYSPVNASIYDGVFSDTLVIVFDINDLGYRMETRAEIELVEPTNIPVSTVCKKGSYSEVYPNPEMSADSLWSNMDVDDFTFGAEVYIKVLETVDCYFDMKQLPAFTQFKIENRESNPWYQRKELKP